MTKELSELERRYIGSANNPFDQFTCFSRASDTLRREVIENEPLMESFYKQLEEKGFDRAGRFIIAFKLLDELKHSNEERWSSEYNKHLFRLKSNGYWMEKTFSSNLSSRENTIFAPLPFHFNDEANTVQLKQLFERRDFESSRKALDRILRLMHNGLQKNGKSVLSKIIDDKDSIFSEIFTPLAEIHFEIADNAYWHALKTDANLNFNQSEDENFFGDTLYLQVHSVDLKTANSHDWSRSTPKEVNDYIGAYNETSPRKDSTRFLMISYIDNGPGIEKHYKRFRQNQDPNTTLEYIVENRVTTRRKLGAGAGLINVSKAVSDMHGCLIIYSGSTIYALDGYRDQKTSRSYPPCRGTMVTIILPV